MTYQTNRLGSDLRRSLMQEGFPATKCLLAVIGILFLLPYFIPLTFGPLRHWIFFDSGDWLTRPWTLLTGSLEALSGWGLLCGMAWLWWVGGSVERSVGTKPYLALWCAISAATGLSLSLCYLLFHVPMPLLFLVLVDALTAVWALLNPFAVINFWCLIRVSSRWLLWLSPVFTLVLYQGVPQGGFACAGCALAWGFVKYRQRRRMPNNNVITIPARRRPRPVVENDLGVVERLQSRTQNERLARLLEDTDPDDRGPVRLR